MKVTISLKRIPLDVEFTYDPGEPRERYLSDLSGHPGSPPSICINFIFHNGEDICDLITDAKLLSDIDFAIWEKLNNTE